MHRGSCHCGQIRFTVDGDFDHAIECNCSHCSRKGYLLFFVPKEKLRLASRRIRLNSRRLPAA